MSQNPNNQQQIFIRNPANYSSPTTKYCYSQELFYKYLFHPDHDDQHYNRYSELNIPCHLNDIKLKDLHPPRDLELTYIPPPWFLRSREIHSTPLTYAKYARRVQTSNSSSYNITNGWERYPNTPHTDLDTNEDPQTQQLYSIHQEHLYDRLTRHNQYIQEHSSSHKQLYPT